MTPADRASLVRAYRLEIKQTREATRRRSAGAATARATEDFDTPYEGGGSIAPARARRQADLPDRDDESLSARVDRRIARSRRGRRAGRLMRQTDSPNPNLSLIHI